MNNKLEVKILDNKMYEYPLRYSTPGSAGIDLRASIEAPFQLYPKQRQLFKTGIAVNIKDPSIVGFITILYNDGQDIYTVEPYERIAQIVFMPVYQMSLDLVDEFSYNMDRGGGFGSTGKT